MLNDTGENRDGYLGNALLILLIGVLLAYSAARIYGSWIQRRAPQPDVANWQRYDDGHSDGSPRAPVVVIEFSDFQCTYCRKANALLRMEQRRHPGSIRVVFRHFPLSSIHPLAEDAALAAECADREGAFYRYVSTLFEHQTELASLSWAQLAALAGITDSSKIDTCVRERATAARVADDVSAGVQLGIKGTPTFLINGILREGVPDSGSFDRLMRRLIATRPQ